MLITGWADDKAKPGSGGRVPVPTVLGPEPSRADAAIIEWADWDILATNRQHPVTRGLHVGFRAPSREAVDAFWHAGIDAGYRDDGAPGPRTVYGPDYYGGFLLDPLPRPRRVQALLRDDRPARRAADRRRRAGPRPGGRRELQLLADRRRA